MKRFVPGKRYKLDARQLADGGTRDKVLILDGHDIEKYRCRFDIEGVDLAEFERTGRQGFFAHDTSTPPICDWKLWKEQGALWGVPTFHSDMNPAAAVIEKLWNADKINAVSIGIDVLETIDSKDDDYTTISKSAPYEVSIVNFGAHPHAGKGLSLMLSAAVAEGVIDQGEADSVTSIVQDADELAAAQDMVCVMPDGKMMPMDPDMTPAQMREKCKSAGGKMKPKAEMSADEFVTLPGVDGPVRVRLVKEDPEGTALRTELETLRTENARLAAELAAKGTPAPEPAAAPEPVNPPEALSREQILSAIREHRRDKIAALAERVYRILTGKLPD